MGAFTTDHSLATRDLILLVVAARGDFEALRIVCQRFRIPVLALALQAVNDFPQAVACVEPILTSLCRELLAGSLLPEKWPGRAMALATQFKSAASETPTESPGLQGIDAVPRVARQRILRQALPKMPLPALTGLLLLHFDGMPPQEMIGLVGENESEVRERILYAHQMLLQALHEPRPDSPNRRNGS